MGKTVIRTNKNQDILKTMNIYYQFKKLRYKILKEINKFHKNRKDFK